jgi:hypothetical protein
VGITIGRYGAGAITARQRLFNLAYRLPSLAWLQDRGSEWVTVEWSHAISTVARSEVQAQLSFWGISINEGTFTTGAAALKDEGARTNGTKDVMYRRARTQISYLISLSLKLQLNIESRVDLC